MPRLHLSDPGPVTPKTQGTFRVFFKFPSIFLKFKKNIGTNNLLFVPVLVAQKQKLTGFLEAAPRALTRSAAQP